MKVGEIMKLSLVNNADTLRIFEFERENESYFRSIGYERDMKYYEYNRYTTMFNDDLQRQKRDQMYMYLIEDDDGSVIGRLTLDDVNRRERNSAVLRILLGERGHGRGLAVQIIQLAEEAAKTQHNMARLTASAESCNIPWQVSLIKAGFSFAGKMTACKRKGPNYIDVVLFEKNF